MQTWKEWLYETVSWGMDCMPRYKAIHHFVVKGLMPFIQSNGYVLACSPRALQSRIATGLYNNRGKSCVESNWRIALENTDYVEHDEGQYWHVLSPEKWEAFWGRWGGWTDVHRDGWRGEDRRVDIAHYVWTQINLEASPQTRVVNESMGWYEEYGEDAGGGREDVYLREAADSGEWGGYRK